MEMTQGVNGYFQYRRKVFTPGLDVKPENGSANSKRADVSERQYVVATP
jgi:hypothetical protein